MRITNELLKLSEENNFAVDNILGLPADSFIYFKQLLKTSLDVERLTLCPFVITIYLIEKLGGLSFDEFTYILPLCIDRKAVNKIFTSLKKLSNTGTLWQKFLFGKNNPAKIKKSPIEYLQSTEF